MLIASFNTSEDGVKAACLLMKEMSAWHEPSITRRGPSGPCIGMHRGQVVAVKTSQTLDFFGQTATIATRVQGLAGPGEIWVTDDIMQDQAAAALLRTAGYSAVAKDVALTGMKDLVRVHSCKR